MKRKNKMKKTKIEIKTEVFEKLISGTTMLLENAVYFEMLF